MPATRNEPEDAVQMVFGIGDEQVSFPLPPTSLNAPATTMNTDNNEKDRDIQKEEAQPSDVHKVDSLVDEGIDEGDTKAVSKMMIESLGYPNEQEVIDALHRSDEEDEGMLSMSSRIELGVDAC